MPKPKKQSKQAPRRAVSPWLVIAVVAVVLLGVGLYGVRAGWFEGDDVDYAVGRPAKGQPRPQAPVNQNPDIIAYAKWEVTEGAPVVAVGGAEGPSAATLVERDGRADVTIRAPRGPKDGPPYTGYSVEVRSGPLRLWGTRLPANVAQPATSAFTISFNAGVLRSRATAGEPITIAVGGTTNRMGDQLGFVQLTLPQTP